MAELSVPGASVPSFALGDWRDQLLRIAHASYKRDSPPAVPPYQPIALPCAHLLSTSMRASMIVGIAFVLLSSVALSSAQAILAASYIPPYDSGWDKIIAGTHLISTLLLPHICSSPLLSIGVVEY